MSSPVWFVEIIKKSFSQAFTFARASNIPGVARLVEYTLFEKDDIVYLPLDRTIKIDRNVERPDDMVLPSQVVEHFIKTAGYHWIMNDCLCRSASDCRDYPIDLGCIFLGEAAEGINPDLGRRVTVSEALEHARRCREAGLVHMIGRNKLDAIWLNVRPGQKLFTICHCCPCCCLWRVLPRITPRVGSKIHRLPGLHVRVTDKCVGCGICTKIPCFVKAIHLVENRAVIDQQECRGCGRCVENCPNEAIELHFEGPVHFKKIIERLSNQVDIT